MARNQTSALIFEKETFDDVLAALVAGQEVQTARPLRTNPHVAIIWRAIKDRRVDVMLAVAACESDQRDKCEYLLSSLPNCEHSSSCQCNLPRIEAMKTAISFMSEDTVVRLVRYVFNLVAATTHETDRHESGRLSDAVTAGALSRWNGASTIPDAELQAYLEALSFLPRCASVIGHTVGFGSGLPWAHIFPSPLSPIMRKTLLEEALRFDFGHHARPKRRESFVSVLSQALLDTLWCGASALSSAEDVAHPVSDVRDAATENMIRARQGFFSLRFRCTPQDQFCWAEFATFCKLALNVDLKKDDSGLTAIERWLPWKQWYGTALVNVLNDVVPAAPSTPEVSNVKRHASVFLGELFRRGFQPALEVVMFMASRTRFDLSPCIALALIRILNHVSHSLIEGANEAGRAHQYVHPLAFRALDTVVSWLSFHTVFPSPQSSPWSVSWSLVQIVLERKTPHLPWNVLELICSFFPSRASEEATRLGYQIENTLTVAKAALHGYRHLLEH